MTIDRPHEVERDLARQGWAVYRQAVGCEGFPTLVAVRPSRTVLLTVAAAIENGRGTYPAWHRAEGADVLASVTRDGEITYADPASRSEGLTLADVVETLGSAPVVPLVASAGRY